MPPRPSKLYHGTADTRAGIVWEREEADALVARIRDAVAPSGCYARLVGSVARKGWSDNDVDVHLIIDEEPKRYVGTLLRAANAIRKQELFLVHQFGGHPFGARLFFRGVDFRPIELWFDQDYAYMQTFRALNRSLDGPILDDIERLVPIVQDARRRGRPPEGFEHVPQAVFERHLGIVARWVGVEPYTSGGGLGVA